MILRRCCFLRWGATTTLVIAWLCNPGSRVFVVGVNDLEELGHCQKSGCRSSPNQVVSHEKYSPPMPNQRERREEIPPSIVLAEFALFFGLLLIASHGLGPVCRSTQRALIAAKEALSLFGGRKKRGTRVWSAGVRGPFVSTGSVMSLGGSLVDLIGTSDHPVLLDDSERSSDEEGRAPTGTTTHRMGGRQPATRCNSYSSSSDFSTGSSSCDSGSSIDGSDIATAPSPTRSQSQKRRSIDDSADSEVGSIMSKFLNLLRRSRRREKKDPPSYGGGSGTGRRDRGRLCATKSRGDECVAHPSLGTPRPRIGRDGLSRVYGEFGHEPRPRGRGWSPAAVNEFFFLGGYATPPRMQSRN